MSKLTEDQESAVYAALLELANNEHELGTDGWAVLKSAAGPEQKAHALNIWAEYVGEVVETLQRHPGALEACLAARASAVSEAPRG
jgi:hypothetical protein